MSNAMTSRCYCIFAADPLPHGGTPAGIVRLVFFPIANPFHREKCRSSVSQKLGFSPCCQKQPTPAHFQVFVNDTFFSREYGYKRFEPLNCRKCLTSGRRAELCSNCELYLCPNAWTPGRASA